jgi:hypothetical protein
MTTSADRLMLEQLNWRHVKTAHTNAEGTTVVTTPHRWQWRRPRQRREVKPGTRLIATGGVLLFLLGLGLLAVSFAAQYQYVLRERHQHVASLIEAGALDVGLIIFSLLALGLARAGLSAKIERAAVIGCAIGSAVMNYAAADVTSPRSALAYCMPPVFLAFVVDRVVRTIQRHVLGMNEARSPWSVVSGATRCITRFWLLSVLYVLRFAVDRRATCAGLRQAILNATPLPEIPATKQGPDRERRKPPSGGRGPTKTARFLDLVKERHGDFARIDPARVGPICTELAAEVGIDPGNARTVLRRAVLAAPPAGEGDDK